MTAAGAVGGQDPPLTLPQRLVPQPPAAHSRGVGGRGHGGGTRRGGAPAPRGGQCAGAHPRGGEEGEAARRNAATREAARPQPGRPLSNRRTTPLNNYNIQQTELQEIHEVEDHGKPDPHENWHWACNAGVQEPCTQLGALHLMGCSKRPSASPRDWHSASRSRVHSRGGGPATAVCGCPRPLGDDARCVG